MVHHDFHHDQTAFPACCRGPVKAAAEPARDGPIIPSNCKTHLTCQPVHPPRKDIWNSWGDYVGDWVITATLWVTGGVVTLGACVYGYSAIDKARKKRRDARLKADGRKPPSDGEGSSGDESDEDRGKRG